MISVRKTRWTLGTLALAMLVAALLPTAAMAQKVDHPRLFVNDKLLAAVRKAAQQSGSHHQRAVAAMKKRVDSGDKIKVYDDHIDPYKYSYYAREAALLSLLATSKAEKKKYADLAYKTIEGIWKDKLPRTPTRGSGLARAMQSLGVGIAYDWCYPMWSQQQRSFVEDKIDEALNAWPRFGHANLGHQRASNWAAVCRGGEMVLLLAAGGDKNRTDRYKKVKRELERHIQSAFGSLGVTQEGIGYTEYPGGFLMPAAYACASVGDGDLLEKLRKIESWRLAMYAENFQPHDRKVLQTGVGHSSNYDEGWVSLLWNLVPEKHQPYYAWFYDRHMGVKAPASSDLERFDSDRAGTVWAVLYYPTDVTPKDPTGVYPCGAADDRGHYFFRSRWQDENDILTSIMADTVHHSHAWDQPEQLALNLMGYNTRFIGGPGKKREDKLYSTLLVDGKYNIRHSVRLTGKKVHFEADKTAGYAIVDGGSLYKELGVDEAKRHLLVDFSKDGSTALLATLDRIRSEKEHTYTWQANLGDDEGADDVKLSPGTEAGRPTFLMKGRNDGYVKGWVVFPADAKLSADGDPLQIEVTGGTQNIWVVMLVGKGTPPKASIVGKGPDAVLTVGGKSVSYNKKTDRLETK